MLPTQLYQQKFKKAYSTTQSVGSGSAMLPTELLKAKRSGTYKPTPYQEDVSLKSAQTPRLQPQKEQGVLEKAGGFVSTTFQKGKRITTGAIEEVKSLDFGRIKTSIESGTKSLPGMVKIAGGVILDSLVQQQKFMDNFFNKGEIFGKKLPEPLKGVTAIFDPMNMRMQAQLMRPLYQPAEEAAKKIREEGQRERAEAIRPYAEMGAAEGGLQTVVEAIVFNAPQVGLSFGLTVGTAFVTKNPYAAGVVGLSTSYGLGASEVYTEARDNGLSDKESLPLAEFGGMLIGAIDFLPLIRIIRKTGGGEVVKKSVISKIANGVVSTGMQSGFEGLTESAQEIVGNAIEQTYNENAELFEGADLAFVVGAFFGGVMDVSVSGINVLTGKKESTGQAIENINQNIDKALTTPASERTDAQKKLVDTILSQEMTAEEAGGFVLHSNLEKEQIGKDILKATIQARNEGKNIKLVTDQETGDIKVELIEKTYIPEVIRQEVKTKETAIVEEEKTKALEFIKEPAEGYRTELEQGAVEALKADPIRYRNDYLAREDVDGNEVNPDKMRLMFEDQGYTGANANEFNRAVNAMTEMTYNHLLDTRQGAGNNIAVFTAGSSGSGKSSFVSALTDKGSYAIILDTTFSYSRAIKRVKQALDNGYHASVRYMLRDPLDAWVNGVLPRVKATGRVIDEAYHLDSFDKARENVLKAYQKYGTSPDVDFEFRRNTKDGMAEISVENVRDFSYNKEEVAEQMRAATEKAYEQKQLTKEQYEAITATRPEKSGVEKVVEGVKQKSPRELQPKPQERQTSRRVLKPAQKQPTVKTKQIVPDEITNYLKDQFGVSVEKATKSQILKALDENPSKIILYSPKQDFLKKIASPQKGYVSPENSYKWDLFYGGIKKGQFTDGYILILDKKVAQTLNNEIKTKQIKEDIKSIQRSNSEITFAKAEKLANDRFNESLNDPNVLERWPKQEVFDRIIPKDIGNEAQVQGYTSMGYKPSVILSDGKTQVVINADMFALMKKHFPDAKVSIHGSAEPVIFSQKGKIQAIAMPLREAKIEMKPGENIIKNRGGRSGASKGLFAELENLTQLPKEPIDFKVVEFPELVRLAKNLTGKVPQVRKLRGGTRGLAYPKTLDIKLAREIFKDPLQAAKTLAHELGHITDYLPDQVTARGNIVGRIATLKKHLKQKYGNLDNKVIKEELWNLSKKWRPFEESESSSSFIKYRKSPEELYADAISVLFNDPVRLQKEAPNFWKGWFEHLDRKPQAKENFFATWDLLNRGEEAVFNARNEELSKSFQKAEDTFVIKELEKMKQDSSFWYKVKLLFDDKNTPVKEDINKLKKQGKVLPPEKNPDYALKGLNYSEAKLRNFVEDNFEPIHKKAQEVQDGWNELGKILFYERVIHERGELANPQGYNPETATKQLEMMQKQFSPDDWAKLQEAKSMFRKAVQKVVDLAAENEYYTPELLKQMKMNPAYATYQVIDYLDTYISPRAYQSVGTLKDIANPATSTVMKLISVYKGIERNNAKKLHVDFYKEYFAGDIQNAKTRWNGRSMEVMDTRDHSQGLVIVIEKGKPQGYYLKKDVAEMLNYAPNSTLQAAATLSRKISLSPIYRPLFTQFNLGFQTFNFARDFFRYWKNVPDYTIGQAITSFPRAGFRYLQATPHAFKRAFNIKDKLITEMENKEILGMTFNDLYRNEVDTDVQQIERVLQGMGILERKKRILDSLVKALDFVGSIGDFIETLPKVAGYKELKGKMPEKELAQFIRTSLGSPDFRTGGTFTPISNNIFLFSNAIKEGIKTDAKIAFTRNPSQVGFWWKTVMADFMPKVIMFGIAAGLMGEKMKEVMDKASEYDKTNYTIIPLGIDKNGKAVYIRKPHDETGRFLGGLFWKLININKDEKTARDVFDLFAFGAGQIPSLSPGFTSVGAIMTYLSGKNPYDDFRGRNVIPDTEFEAGWKESLPIFLQWLANEQGLGIVIPRYKLEENATELEKFTNLPLLSNILGRWIRTTDFGETEQLRKISQAEDKRRAQERLDKERKVEKAIKDFQSSEQSVTRRNQIERQLIEDVIGQIKDSDDKRARTNLIKEFRIGIVKGKADPLTSALIYAQTNDEKVLILSEAKKKLGDKYTEFEREMLKEGIISKNVINDLRRL